MKKFNGFILSVIGIFVIIAFLFLIIHLMFTTPWLAGLLQKYCPVILPSDISTTQTTDINLILQHTDFIMQYLSWAVTLVGFAFTAFAFFGIQRLSSLREAEEDIKKKFEALQNKYVELQTRETSEFEFATARIFYLQGYYTDALEILYRLTDQSSFEVCLYRGHALQKTGDYPNALLAYENSLKSPDVDKAKVYYGMGLCWFQSKVYDTAIGFFEKAISEKSSFLDAYIDKARALRWKGDLREAVEILKQILKFSSQNPRANYNLACYLALLEDKDWGKYLEIVLKINALRYVKLAKCDADFTRVKDSEQFKEILQKHTPVESSKECNLETGKVV
jgi:tetratricopeptide (TPR) repeat protein